MDARVRELVKATIPVLKEHGVALTTYFYQRLFRHNPELKNIFNQSHNETGKQPVALAMAVLAYAENIDDPSVLAPVITLIANKHASVGIRAEHYPIVGSCLLRAIEEVLGSDIATAQVLAAWGAAYNQLADILIGAEAAIYDEKAAAPGGWRGGREFKLVSRVEESSEITSFYFRPVDQQAILDCAPGQYIGLKLIIDGEEVRRNYSLSALARVGRYRISVKREAGGVVSNFLHDRLQVGDTLELFPPAGEFTLTHSEKPLVLISGGVGITPTLPMLEAALATRRPIHFIHCARNADVHAFRTWVDELAAQHPQLQRFYCYAEQHAAADHVGLLTEDVLAQWLPADRDVDAYFLGPKGFMGAVKRQLKALGVPQSQSRYEFFGPAADLQ